MSATALNSTQVRLLQAAVRMGRPVPADKLAEKAGVAASPENLGPVSRETLEAGNGKYAESLFGLGLMRPVSDGVGGTQWEATAKGKSLAPKMVAREKTDAAKVPAKELDTVAKKFRATRTYGFECYTDADLKDLAKQLPAEFHAIPPTVLRAQLANRRKQGAFADPADKVRASVAKFLREFGPDGTVRKNFLTDAQVKALEKLAESAGK